MSAMADTFARDRLQPALLDRLIDDRIRASRVEPPDERTISRATGCAQSVLRDLSWLLNATAAGARR
jgi:predicted component of type VI protein secretion system